MNAYQSQEGKDVLHTGEKEELQTEDLLMTFIIDFIIIFFFVMHNIHFPLKSNTKTFLFKITFTYGEPIKKKTINFGNKNSRHYCITNDPKDRLKQQLRCYNSNFLEEKFWCWNILNISNNI